MDFASFKRRNPSKKFSDYYVHYANSLIAEGTPHRSLGRNLRGSDGDTPFFEAGKPLFEKYRDLFAINPSHKVLDYGCGSLRLGVHFVEYLERGNYFGLDLTYDFITYGIERLEELCGNDHAANFGLIHADFGKAAAFEADFIVSSNVAYHVHPDECGDYYSNLQRLAKPDAELVFDARVATDHRQLSERQWAWPLAFYVDQLDEFELTKVIPNEHKISQRLQSTDAARATFHFRKR